MRPQNLLFFLTESHAAQLLGCAGDPLVQTPNIDRLAARGVLFDQCYCNSPICVPARSAIATGKYPHQTGHWDNSHAYHGDHLSWMEFLRDKGHEVTAIGKLHFRSDEDDNGFSEEIETMHLLEGEGELIGLLRAVDAEPARESLWKTYTVDIGAGDPSGYQEYDLRVTELANDWLRKHAAPAEPSTKPWVLCVNYVSAHPPFKVPKRLLDLYPLEDVPLPWNISPEDRPRHPAIEHLRKIVAHEDMMDEKRIKTVVASYFALITYLDEQIGKVLDNVDELGLSETTRILYTADHGYNYGNQYIFGLFNFYDPTARIPLIIAGPDMPQGEVRNGIVSHVDLFPTILEMTDEPPIDLGIELPGTSLCSIAEGASLERVAFGENHAAGTKSAAYLLRKDRYKLIYHVGMPPQLFDMVGDPNELTDLAASPEHAETLSELETALRRIVDPEIVDAEAKAAQLRRIAELGGKDEILRRRGKFGYSPPPEK